MKKNKHNERIPGTPGEPKQAAESAQIKSKLCKEISLGWPKEFRFLRKGTCRVEGCEGGNDQQGGQTGLRLQPTQFQGWKNNNHLARECNPSER